MPLYEFACDRCGDVNEEYYSISNRPAFINCPYCLANGKHGVAYRIISLPHTHKDKLFSFTDIHTTGKPVQINSKGEWKRHLKKLGMNDDIPQRPLKDHEVKDMTVNRNFDKKKRHEDLKKAIVKDLASAGKIRGS